MKIIDVISLLKEQGHDVEYRKRTDGGYLITKINGKTYKAAEGNAAARSLTGQSLSAARAAQTALNVRTKIIKPTLDADIKKEIARVQRKWKKHPPRGGGKITTRKIRYNIEKYGKDEALRRLRSAERYAEGMAYDLNVQYLYERVIRLYQLTGDANYEDIANRILEFRHKFREDWIEPIYSILYEAEKKAIASSTAKSRIFAIIK